MHFTQNSSNKQTRGKNTVNTDRKARLEPAIRDAQKLAQNVFPPWTLQVTRIQDPGLIAERPVVRAQFNMIIVILNKNARGRKTSLTRKDKIDKFSSDYGDFKGLTRFSQSLFLLLDQGEEGSSAHRVLEKLRTTQWKFGGNPGGVRTTIAMHCGCKIFKIAAEVEKFRRLYALFLNRYSSFLRSFLSIS